MYNVHIFYKYMKRLTIARSYFSLNVHFHLTTIFIKFKIKSQFLFYLFLVLLTIIIFNITDVLAVQVK